MRLNEFTKEVHSNGDKADDQVCQSTKVGQNNKSKDSESKPLKQEEHKESFVSWKSSEEHDSRGGQRDQIKM